MAAISFDRGRAKGGRRETERKVSVDQSCSATVKKRWEKWVDSEPGGDYTHK